MEQDGKTNRLFYHLDRIERVKNTSSCLMKLLSRMIRKSSASWMPTTLPVNGGRITKRMLADFVAQQPGYLRGYPASNWNWATAVMDGTIPFEDIRRWVDESYEATRTKAKNKRTPLLKKE